MIALLLSRVRAESAASGYAAAPNQYNSPNAARQSSNCTRWLLLKWTPKREHSMGVMRAYVDVSGSQADQAVPAICAAGFVAKPSEWEAFETAWTGVLRRFDIVQFGMEECAHFSGVFDPWKKNPKREEIRVEFLSALVDAAASVSMFGVAGAVKIADWNALNLEYCARERYATPYGLMASFAGQRLLSCELVRECKPRAVRIFVEHGDANQSELFELIKRNPIPGLAMVPLKKKDVGTDGSAIYVRPFELADMLAFEHRLFVQRIGDNARPIRKLAQEMEKKLRLDHGTWEMDRLRWACEMTKTAKRFGSLRFRSAPGSDEY